MHREGHRAGDEAHAVRLRVEGIGPVHGCRVVLSGEGHLRVKGYAVELPCPVGLFDHYSYGFVKVSGDDEACGAGEVEKPELVAGAE